jgi:SAM-dependent methyltransferase
MPADHALDVEAGHRFEFGENWSKFLLLLTEARIRAAEESLKAMLERNDFVGLRVLDAGSGSGLFSLALRRMGAAVHSFDFDPKSVKCTVELRRLYFPNDADWTVDEASVLDAHYLGTLGQFDLVYSWGVLHHTGRMWEGLTNLAALVAPGGKLFIAIYNDQGKNSRRWTAVKRLYNAAPAPFRPALVLGVAVHQWWRRWLKDLLKLRPFETWRNVQKVRGMSAWRDVVDWVGGYPFEVAKPEQIFDFYRARNFTLTKLYTDAGGSGCNEFIFEKRA